MKKVAVVCFEVLMRLIFALPRFRWMNAVKSLFLRLLGARVGKRVTYYPGVWIAPGRNLVLGDDVDLALDVLLTTGGGVEIGDRTLVGYRSQIISANHTVPDGRRQIFNAGHVGRRVVIGRDVWIGAACVVLPGTTIGEGAVIGAGSVVRGDVPAFAVAAGVPARVIRYRS